MPKLSPNPLLLAIAGPTAVGKTAVALRLAAAIGAPILSFDSRQCYRELGIAVAKPSVEELQRVPHYFVDSHSVHQPVDAANYEHWALSTLQALFVEHNMVIAVGGTGLYLKALLQGLDAMPTVDEATRATIRSQYEQLGLPWLQAQLLEKDPLFAEQGEMQNPHRMLRALEVVTVSGKSIISFQTGTQKQRPFQHATLVLTQEREVLYQCINQRVESMMQDGLLNEAEQLYPLRHLTALQTVGYQELFDFFEGKTHSVQHAVEQIKTNTRQYAKRQVTWFNRLPGITQAAAANEEAIEQWFNEQMGTGMV